MGRSIVQYGGLVTVLSTDKDFYYPGEQVYLFLEAVNVSFLPISLTFSTTQRYEFIVAGLFGEVWRWSAGNFFAQGDYQVPQFMPRVVESITLGPGENLFCGEVWNQEGTGGLPVPQGTYQMSGWNTFNEFEYLPKPNVYIDIGIPAILSFRMLC
ncbi:BsuPI-related putative proteinase inhibitor [Phosphitispora sp. TUW77]|uniref:BsuPI-related putative proteinase inhibitor n=1 Tax=Phosphitispora sp. TUW77 TaxID=3152361 RepID=UPI003AB64E98